MTTDTQTRVPAERTSVFGTNVVAFVYDDAGLLLLVRQVSTGWHEVPSGTQEIGETVTQTAVRVVLEQTGVDAAITGLVGVHSRNATDGDMALCFHARPVAGTLLAADAGKQAAWVEPEYLDEIDMDPGIRRRIAHCAQTQPEQFHA